MENIEYYLAICFFCLGLCLSNERKQMSKKGAMQLGGSTATKYGHMVCGSYMSLLYRTHRHELHNMGSNKNSTFGIFVEDVE